MYYVKRTESQLWTVGAGEGSNWEPVSDHGSLEEAEEKAAYMNGGPSKDFERDMRSEIRTLNDNVAALIKAIKETDERVTALECLAQAVIESDKDLARRVEKISDQVRKTAKLAVAIGEGLSKKEG